MDDGDSTDSFDLENPDEVHVGVSRGELDLEIGPPRDHPDRADVSVRPESNDRVVLTVDVAAADHAIGHADVPFSLSDARTLRDVLDETIRWMSEDANESGNEDESARKGA